ncbi:MAG: PEP-CTERM sorting domain-containing protein [Pirellula sp.]
MQKLVGAFLATVLLAQTGQAAIVFSLSPASQTIPQGTNGLFNLFIRSDTTPVIINSLDVNVVAGAGNGTGGIFLASSTQFLGSTAFDVTTTPGQAFSTNFQQGGTEIGTTNTLYGILNLRTVGVAPGTYNMQLNNLFANNPVTSSVPTLAINATYTIEAVPEPGTFALVGLAVLGFGSARWIRKKYKK